jgi:hypothetical protein
VIATVRAAAIPSARSHAARAIADDGRAPATSAELRSSRAFRDFRGCLGGRGRICLAGEAGIGKTCTAELLAGRARARLAPRSPTAWRGDAGGAVVCAWTGWLRELARRPPALAELPPAQGACWPISRQSSPRASAPALAGESPFASGSRGRAGVPPPCATARSRSSSTICGAGAESLALLELVGQTLDQLRIAIAVRAARRRPRSRRSSGARSRPAAPTARALALSGLQGDELRELRARARTRRRSAAARGLDGQTPGGIRCCWARLASLGARGLLGERRDASAWESLLPRGIQHLERPKLRELSAGAVDALCCAAAIGVELERGLLARCVPDESQLAAQLRELEAAGLLSSDSSFALRVRFGHNLIREALYAELVPPGAGRRALHARVAAALPTHDPSPDSAAERAHHACEAAPLVEPARASALAQAVAEHAQRLHDFERAAAWYARALAALELDSDADSATAAQLCISSAPRTRGGQSSAQRPGGGAAARAARHGPCSRLALGFAHRPTRSVTPSRVIGCSEATRALPDDATAAAHPLAVPARRGAALHRPQPSGGLVGEAVADARKRRP